MSAKNEGTTRSYLCGGELNWKGFSTKHTAQLNASIVRRSTGSGEFDRLPVEILYNNIFAFFELKDFLVFQLVNKYFCELIDQPFLWKRISKHLPLSRSPSIHLEPPDRGLGWFYRKILQPPFRAVDKTQGLKLEVYQKFHRDNIAKYTKVDLPINPKVFKLVIVGDYQIGKTSALYRYIYGSWPREYMPTSIEENNIGISYFGKLMQIIGVELSRQEDYNRMRPLNYFDADGFVLMFSLVDVETFQSACKKWHPELRYHRPKIPIVLAGNMLDLFQDEDYKAKHQEEATYTSEQGREYAKKHKLAGYCEFSSLTGEGFSQVFMTLYQAEEMKK